MVFPLESRAELPDQLLGSPVPKEDVLGSSSQLIDPILFPHVGLQNCRMLRVPVTARQTVPMIRQYVDFFDET